MLIAFNKPFGVLSQFTADGSANRTLAEFDFPKRIYPIGRLDADSEGLLLLSDERELNQRLLHPKHAHEREYFAQVERRPSSEALRELERGCAFRDAPPGPAGPGCSNRNRTGRRAIRPSVFGKCSDLLDRAGTHRRKKPPGAPHDRRHRTPDLAIGAGADRTI